MKFKMFTSAFFVALLAASLSGCFSLPKFPPPPTPVSVQAESATVPSHGILPEWLTPTPKASSAPEMTLRTGAPEVTRADLNQPASSPATHAIQVTVNWFATLAILGGLALLGLGIFLIVNGHVVPGIKFALCGLLVPIFGIWFAFHWLLVVIVALLAVAVLELSAHYVIVAPLLHKIETHAKTIVSGTLTPFMEKL